jgi:hypothetical protein
MIKFRAKGDNGDIYGLGLSAKNVELLKQGKPIVIDMTDIGVPGRTIMLFYGETEQDIVKELKGYGLIPESADVSKPDPGMVRIFRDLNIGNSGEPGV